MCNNFFIHFYPNGSIFCKDACPKYYYPYKENFTCISECDSPLNMYFTKESTSVEWVDCLFDCPEGTYSTQNKVCDDCNERCLTCDNKISCILCAEGYTKVLNLCLKDCEDPYNVRSSKEEDTCLMECPSLQEFFYMIQQLVWPIFKKKYAIFKGFVLKN